MRIVIYDDNTAFLTPIEEIVSRTYRDMQKELSTENFSKIHSGCVVNLKLHKAH